MKSKYGWYAIGGYFLVLVILLIAVPFIRCTGEWCALTPLGWASFFWGNILMSASLHWYWFFEDIPGFHLLVFTLNLLTVYGLGVLIGRWRHSKQ